MEVTVHEAKTHLSRLLRRVEAGESIVILRGKKPVAVLSSASEPRARRQIWGDLKGQMEPDFDETPADFEDYV